MSDDFFSKTKCDRCGESLSRGRIMSMYSTECICMKCHYQETLRSDYKEAVQKDLEEYKNRQFFKCCICGRESKGFGNNPVPISYSGICCDECNSKVVIPARMQVPSILKSFADSLEDN